MTSIPCPWCGPRDEAEFHSGGAAHIPRAAAPGAPGDAAWADYLYRRDNPSGAVAERWLHHAGCRRWFDVLRDTVSGRIVAVCKGGDAAPGLGAFGGDP